MIKKEGSKWVLFSKDGTKTLGKFDSEEEVKRREKEILRFTQKSETEEIFLTVKATLDKDGKMRWKASVSDTSEDKRGEKTSLSLFKSWIDAIKSNNYPSFLPPPRNPFLGISHYPSFQGEGEVGPTEVIYIDGSYCKAKGTFLPGLLGKAVFNTLRKEQELIAKGETVEMPVKISAAWFDLQHSHGSFIFTRKSLADKCPMCEQGIGDKIYLKGQLDHFAATRVPVNPNTDLALEVKSVTTTRQNDAASIVGEELASSLEEKAVALIGKAGVETENETLVIKAKEETKKPLAKTVKEAEKEIEVSEDGGGLHVRTKGVLKMKPKIKKVGDMEYTYNEEDGEYYDEDGNVLTKKKMSYKQAKSLAVKKRTEINGTISQWDIFKSLIEIVLEDDNVSESSKITTLKAIVDEFDAEIDEIKSSVVNVYLGHPIEGGNPVTITQNDNDPTLQLKAKVDAILENKSLTRPQVEEELNNALQNYVSTLKAQVDNAHPVPVLAIEAAVEKMLTPLVEKLNLAVEGLKTPALQTQAPIQKSFSPQQPIINKGLSTPVSPITGQQSGLTAMIRRSVGIS